MCSGLSPTAAVHIQEEIKAFLDLDFDSDDVLGMLEASECDSRSVGAVCLPVACPESDAGSALELKRVGSGEVPGPIRFESSARVAKIRGQCRPRRRPSSEICLVKAFKHKCKGVRPLPVGTQDIDGEALDCGKASHAMEDASSGVDAFRAACQVEKSRHDFLSVLSDGDVYTKAGAMRKRPRLSKALSLAGNGEAITKSISVRVRGKRSPPAGLDERTYHFLTTVAPTASFCVVYEYSLKRYRKSSLGLSQLAGLIEMQRSGDLFDSGCKEQEPDGGVAPTASVRSDVDVIDVTDDDAYTRSSDVTGVVKQETDGRRPLPSDVPLVMKAEPTLGLSQLSGLIEMQRNSDFFDSGCKEQELDGGVAPTASVRSDVDVIDVSDDDAYIRSSDVTGVVKQETDGRRPLPSDVPLVMKAEPKPEIKREPSEGQVVSSRVSLDKVSAAEVASPHAHSALKVETDASRRKEASGQPVLTHPPVGSVLETREQQPVKREALTPDLHVR